jgi:hypothetical protein
MNEGPPRGAPPFKSLFSAYRELLEGLWYAHKEFTEKRDAGHEEVRIACQAVARFIAVRHENPELAAPFLAMRQALTDLDNGKETEILSSNPNDMKRSRSGQKGHLKAVASACLELLVPQMGLHGAVSKCPLGAPPQGDDINSCNLCLLFLQVVLAKF